MGKKAQQVIDFSYKLEEKGEGHEKIMCVSSSLSPPYRSGIQFSFPKAKHTVHVKKLILDAMDEVRKPAQDNQKKISRKLLMIPEGRQNEGHCIFVL